METVAWGGGGGRRDTSSEDESDEDTDSSGEESGSEAGARREKGRTMILEKTVRRLMMGLLRLPSAQKVNRARQKSKSLEDFLLYLLAP